MRVVWYDGGLKPPYPAEMEGKPLPAEGTLYVGEEGKMLGSTILTASRAKKFEGIAKTLPPAGHLGRMVRGLPRRRAGRLQFRVGRTVDRVCALGQYRHPHRQVARVGRKSAGGSQTTSRQTPSCKSLSVRAGRWRVDHAHR